MPLAGALRAGGINAIGVTARSEAAFDAIRAIRTAFPDMTVFYLKEEIGGFAVHVI